MATPASSNPPHTLPILIVAFFVLLGVGGYRNYRILEEQRRLHNTPCINLTYEQITTDDINFIRCQFELQLRQRSRAQLPPT